MGFVPEQGLDIAEYPETGLRFLQHPHDMNVFLTLKVIVQV
jgi:hypothetical protein